MLLHCDPKGLGSQRCNGPKSARPSGVEPGRPLDGVAALARATRPCGAPLLASDRPGSITVFPIREGKLLAQAQNEQTP